MTTFSYLRVSTIDQDTEKNKLDILMFANSKKLGNVEFTEEKITGKIHYSERALGKLLEKLKQSDVLIVPELSRLARSVTQILEIINLCKQKEITLYSLKEGFNSGDSGITSVITSTVFALVAQIEMHDFLGKVFSVNDMGSSYKGQFFTPYHVSKMMAEISATDLETKIKNKKVLTLSEPCSGAGGMVITFAQTMRENGYNYQNRLFVEAIDVDDICFKMTYVQLCLLGIPARVIKGNSLTLEYQEVLYTSMFFINGWDYRLNSILADEDTEELKDEDIDEESVTEILETVQTEIEPTIRIDREQIQLSLFGE